jgi:type IV pilus assembly protein PilW
MKNQKGFTLIELLIAMVVGGILIGAIYTTYSVQQEVFTAQNQVAEMQQNIRAALLLTTREIRMAGYDPVGTSGAGFEDSFLPAPSGLRAGRIRFTLDADESGGLLNVGSIGERIELGFSPTDDANGDGIPDADSDGDGIPDAVSFRRQIDTDDVAPPGFQAVADNIQAVEFQYLDATDSPTAVLADIRAVRFSILARAANPDPKYTNGNVYCPESNAQGLCTDPAEMIWGPYNDNFRRRLLITTIQCRNMGL